MAGDSLKFRSENSVLSKINGTPDPTVSQDLTSTTSDASNNGSSKITDNQSELSAKEGQGLNKVNNAEDPAKGSDGLSVNDMKNKSNAKSSEKSDLAPINETKVDAKSDADGNIVSNVYNSGKSYVSDWLKTRKEEAINKLREYAIESVSNITNPKSDDVPDSNENTRSTPKSSMGRVPALDAQRPSPEIPNTTGQKEIPSPKMPPRTPANAMPKMNMPKVSVPKMRFR